MEDPRQHHGGGTWDERENVTDEFGDMILEDLSLSPRISTLPPATATTLPSKGTHESPSVDQMDSRVARQSAPGSPYRNPRGADDGAGDAGGAGDVEGAGSIALQEDYRPRHSYSSPSRGGGGGGGGEKSHITRNETTAFPSSSQRHHPTYGGRISAAHSASSAGRLRGERSEGSLGSRRSSQMPYDPKRDPQEGFIGHPMHYGFGSTKRFWDPASGGEKESQSLFYFGRDDERGGGGGGGEGSGRRGRASSAAAAREPRPSVMEQTVLTPQGKMIKPFGVNWQARKKPGEEG